MLQSCYPSVQSVHPGTRHARGIWPAPDNTKDFIIYFGTVSVRRRCGHTSSRSGRERRYHPLKWSCTNKQHCRGRHLSYLRSVREIIKQVFPDHADIVGQAWKRIWWIACSVCVTTLWTQRNRNIHKQESKSFFGNCVQSL